VTFGVLVDPHANASRAMVMSSPMDRARIPVISPFV
jgi:hypothetical protein